jgi:hypothetical protein
MKGYIRTRLLIMADGTIVSQLWADETPQSLGYWRAEARRLCARFERRALRVLTRSARPGQHYPEAENGEVLVVPARPSGQWPKSRIVKVGPENGGLLVPPPVPVEEYRSAPAAEGQA